VSFEFYTLNFLLSTLYYPHMIYGYILLILPVIGVLETIYLITKRRKGQKPICVGKDDCNLVLQSKYNKTFGVHNDVLGLAFYTFSLFVILSLFLPLFPIDFLVVIFLAYCLGLIIALIMSIRFIYLMAYKIKAWCQWCIGSAVTVCLMTVAMILLLMSAY